MAEGRRRGKKSPGSAGREGNSLCAFKGEEGGEKFFFPGRREEGGSFGKS